MALQIPPLGNDRPTHPQWAAAAPPDRQSLAAALLADALESLPGSAGVDTVLLESLRRLGAGAAVELLLSADRASVAVLLDGRRIMLGPQARDAALALIEGLAAPPAQAPGAAPSAAPAIDPAALASAASIEAQLRQARAQAGVAPAPPEPAQVQQAVALARPLLSAAGAPPATLPALLSKAVESSGLFLEAHVAQWLRGERSLAQLQGEFSAAPPWPDGAADAQARASAQLDALQRQAIALTGEAWPGQPVRWEIERDRERHREAANLGDATGLFRATLRLDLHRLGGMQAHIRVVEGSVGVQIQAEHPAAFTAELARLADALAARGLDVVTVALDPGKARRPA
jgi:hypothetical protein